jgi:hypothetical protein
MCTWFNSNVRLSHIHLIRFITVKRKWGIASQFVTGSVGTNAYTTAQQMKLRTWTQETHHCTIWNRGTSHNNDFLRQYIILSCYKNHKHDVCQIHYTKIPHEGVEDRPSPAWEVWIEFTQLGAVMRPSVVWPCITLNSIKQSPSWEANSRSLSQEIPRLLCNPNVQYCLNKNPPLVPLLSQMNPVQNLTPYFFNRAGIAQSAQRLGNFLLPPVSSYPYMLCPNIFLSILFSNTLNLFFP